MRKDFKLDMHTKKYKVGDWSFLCRNAGKKVKCVWLGPGIVTQITSDRVCAIQNRRYVKIIHHDKLRPCNSRQLPK